MPIDPVAGACQALVDHLTTALGDDVAEVRRGWPEHGTELDLTSGPIVTVTASDPTEARMAPRQVDSAEDDEGNLVVTYKVAELRFMVQVDAWVAYRAQLDTFIPTVEAALQEEPPGTSGLWLEQDDDEDTGYYGRPLAFEVVRGAVREPDDQAVSGGEWRAFWVLECVTDKVAVKTHTKLARLDATAQFSGGSSGEETRTTVTST